MGRRAHHQALDVWMNGQRIGQWRVSPRKPDEFQYDRAWCATPEARALSLSLAIPFDDVPLKGPQVKAYFDNLLPDSDPIRRRIQSRFATASQSAFDLLSAIGRDCVGAVQLLPPNIQPEDIHQTRAQPLDDEEVAQYLRDCLAPRAALGRNRADEDEFRISLAGAQEKTALLRHEGRWCRPLGATPTTHIFKLPLGLVGNRQADMSTSVENEWLSMEILRVLGIPTAATEIGHFGNQKALIVERFDRKLAKNGKYWLRLPQEDFCQALGYPPSRKYETDGGPGMVQIGVILANSAQAQLDLSTFFRAQVVFALMAATDGHAKNFSLALLPGGTYKLTPMYDVLSAWPVVGNGPNQLDQQRLRLAMDVCGKNRHYRIQETQPRHFIETAKRCGFLQLERDMQQILDELPHALASLEGRLPPDFPPQLANAVFEGMRQGRSRFVRAGAHV